MLEMKTRKQLLLATRDTSSRSLEGELLQLAGAKIGTSLGQLCCGRGLQAGKNKKLGPSGALREAVPEPR